MSNKPKAFRRKKSNLFNDDYVTIDISKLPISGSNDVLFMSTGQAKLESKGESLVAYIESKRVPTLFSMNSHEEFYDSLKLMFDSNMAPSYELNSNGVIEIHKGDIFQVRKGTCNLINHPFSYDFQIIYEVGKNSDQKHLIKNVYDYHKNNDVH